VKAARPRVQADYVAHEQEREEAASIAEHESARKAKMAADAHRIKARAAAEASARTGHHLVSIAGVLCGGLGPTEPARAGLGAGGGGGGGEGLGAPPALHLLRQRPGIGAGPPRDAAFGVFGTISSENTGVILPDRQTRPCSATSD
jgi:hypothetical protein